MLGMGNDPTNPTEDTINDALDKIEQATERRPDPPLHRQRLPPGHPERELRRLHRLVRRHRPGLEPRRPLRVPRGGRHVVVRHDGHPARTPPNGVAAAKFMNFVYDPVNAAQIAAYVQFISPVKGVQDELVKLGGDAAALAESPLLFPGDAEKANMYVYGDMSEELDTAVTDRFLTITAADQEGVSHGDRRRRPHAAQGEVGARTCWRCPALRFIYLFFLVPLVTLLKISLSEPGQRGQQPGRLHLGVEQLLEGLHRLRRAPVAGARLRGGHHDRAASCWPTRWPTSSPSRSGRWRNLLLGLVMVPFFTSFLLRTIAWQSLFADNGPVLGIAESLHLDRPPRRRCTSPPTARSSTPRPAVIGGLDLQLPALRPPADLREPREDPDQPLRRRQRPLLAVRQHVPAGDLPDVAARGVRRHAARVHPGLGRLHQPAPARRREQAGDRRRHPGPVPPGRRLSRPRRPSASC